MLIVISTAAVVASIVTMPMLYSYVASFQSHLITETEFCKTRARDMWTEMSVLQSSQGHVRGKRQYGSSPQPAAAIPTGYGPVANPEVSGACCNCQQGPPLVYVKLTALVKLEKLLGAPVLL